MEGLFSESAKDLRSLSGVGILNAIPKFRVELGELYELDSVTLVLTDGRTLDITAEASEGGLGELGVIDRGKVPLHDCDCPATNTPPNECICRQPGAEPGGRSPTFDTPEGYGPPSPPKQRGIVQHEDGRVEEVER